MPEISRFFGIVIVMFYGDHPQAHFHARYGDQKVTIAIASLSVLSGDLPPRVLGLVMEWASMHQKELLEDWRLLQQHAPLTPIPPLE